MSQHVGKCKANLIEVEEANITTVFVAWLRY